jgi:hypothetical protein
MKFNLFGIFSHKSKEPVAAPIVPPTVAPTDTAMIQTTNFGGVPVAGTTFEPINTMAPPPAPVVDNMMTGAPINSVQPSVTPMNSFNAPIEPAVETSSQPITNFQPLAPPSGVMADVVTPSVVPPENNSPSQPTPPLTPPSQF